MTRQHAFAAASAAALLLAAGPAFASDEGYYVSGTGGVSLTPDLRLKGTTTGTQKENFDTGYVFGGAVGYDNGDGQRIEINSQYNHAPLASINGTSTSGTLAATSIMVNGQMDLTQNTDTTPYVGAGVGVQYIDAKVGAYSGTDWKPAYQVEAGLRHKLTDRMSLYGEYRFTQSEAAHVDNGFDNANQHYSDHGLLAGLTYKIGE